MGVVDEVKGRLDIVDIVSGYVPSLKKAGRTYKGLCPFHTEKTPSFVVYPETQTWHCFGACGTGGDVFSFVMRQEGYDFREALTELAGRAGVPLQEKSAEMVAADKAFQKYLDMVSAASAYFHDLLLNAPQAAFARDYVANRGLTTETVGKFQLGYALNQWEALKTYLLEKGYAEADMIAVGLLIERENSKGSYDRFRDRFVVPIRDVRGRVIGFGARALHDHQVPKYLNSPQSTLFDKSAVLYGLDLAKSAIRDQDQAVIVEGYMDVLQAHQRGFSNVVASMGTSLTEQQLRLLKRYTDKFVLALDADTAGNAATLRGINAAREVLDEQVPVPTAQRGVIRYDNRLNVDIRITSLPPGKDPDDIVREDPAAWQQLIAEAKSLVDYFIQTTLAGLNLDDARDKSQAIRQILPVLREVSDSVEQDHYLRQLARLVRIDERTLRTELQRTSPNRSKTASERVTTKPVFAKPTQPVSKRANSKSAQREEYCLAMLIGHPKGLGIVNQWLQDNHVTALSANDFLSSENSALYQVINNWISSAEPTLDALLPLVDSFLEGHLASIVALWHQQPESPVEYLDKQLTNMVLHLRRDRLKQQASDLRHLQNDAFASEGKEAASRYSSLINEVGAKLTTIHKAQDALSVLGRRRVEEKYH